MELRQLAARYDRPGPRYTSYPTVPEWSEAFDADALGQALGRVSGPDLSVYVHVPFCERLCAFCACNRVITQDHGRAGPFLDALEAEAELLARALPKNLRAVQLAVGGGSPNFLAPDELQRLAGLVDRHFRPALGAERSIELDPRNTTHAQLEVLAECGFNRISLGVQDTSPQVQRAIHRVQSLEQIEALTSGAAALGMRSTSFDLIYGLPYQTEASFAETLDQVLALRPDRLALYSYAHVTWVSKAQRGFERKDLPTPERKLAIFTMAIERLSDAGYQHLGMDHFARPEDDLARAAERGELRRNFMGYTTRAGVDLVALGPSGICELADAYAQSEKDPDAWQARTTSGRLATVRGHRLSEDDQRRRWLIQQLMCAGRIDPARFQARFDSTLDDTLPEPDAQLADLVEEGLLEPRAGGWDVTALGRLFLRVIAMRFDAYLGESAGDTRRFSRTV